MNGNRRHTRWMTLLALLAALALVVGPAPPVRAAYEDVAMYYEALAPYGAWVDYGDYGPVWYPSGVDQEWRPYTNGRWVPTAEGWVFETDEPWGWAAYHYGNWMPTTEYGWVWVPGTTWYPSTVAWRTSEEHVGWAPIPPPNYVPPPAFYPSGGYHPGIPVLELLTAPFWIFAQAANFLLGFGQPYTPSYSYNGCGCLAPYAYVPTFFPRTVLLTDFYSPFWAPRAFYCFGPSFPFVARAARIDVVRINNFVNVVNIINIRNGVPGREILDRHPHIRHAIPGPVLEGRRFPIERAADGRRVERELARPDVLRPREVPRVRPEIPKALAVPSKERGPEALRGVKGMGVPHKAESRMTPQMEEKVRLHQEGRRLREQPPVERRGPEVIRPAPRPAPREEMRPSQPKFVPTPREEVRPQPRPVPREEFRPQPRAVPREDVRPQPRFAPPPRPEVRPAPAPREVRPAPPPKERNQVPKERKAPQPRHERVD